MASLPCADRCPDVAGVIRRQCRTQFEERAVRVSFGLTPEYVPPLAPAPGQAFAVCRKCTHVYFGSRAAADAETCALGD